MNVNQFLTEMQAAGYRFYVTPHPSTGKQGILTLFPDTSLSAKSQARILELETWRKTIVTNQQLVKALLANELKPTHKESRS